MIYSKDLALKNELMDHDLKAIIRMGKKMEKEFIFEVMGQNTMENGLIIQLKDKFKN